MILIIYSCKYACRIVLYLRINRKTPYIGFHSLFIWLRRRCFRTFRRLTAVFRAFSVCLFSLFLSFLSSFFFPLNLSLSFSLYPSFLSLFSFLLFPLCLLLCCQGILLKLSLGIYDSLLSFLQSILNFYIRFFYFLFIN